MNKLFTFCFSLVLASFFAHTMDAANHFPSSNPMGVIGVSEDSPIDNPEDNVFHVQVEEQLTDADRIWLVYELDGVSDYSSVSHSVNDQLAQGGYLVAKSKGFQQQREMLPAAWLRQGDNVIRFSLPTGARHSYRVQNLKLEVEKNTAPLRQLVVNPSMKGIHFGKMAYLKGFVGGMGAEKAQVFVDGMEVGQRNGGFERIIERAVEQEKWEISIRARFPDGEVLEKIVVLEKREEMDYRFRPSSPLPGLARLFGTEENASLSYASVQLGVPAGALANPMVITVSGLRDVDMPALDPGMVNVTSAQDGFRFLPHVKQFEKDLEIKMGFDPAKIPAGYTEKDIRTYFFDEESHHWVALPRDTVDAESGVVVSRSNHFTDMINGIIKVPESPEGDAFTPTSIKDIKAANPSASINMIEPPSANQMGNANLGYPIVMPPGRNGIQPQLGINYNSGGGNGWLGLGWNMQMPSISLDTRWGVPRYNPGLETETYLLNGEQLTPLSHRDQPIPRTSEKQFYPRVEGGFSKVIRHGTDPTNYWWEVTDKMGMRFFYGGTPSTGLDNSAVLKDDVGNVAQWCLREMRDLNDNFCRYHYVKVNDVGTNGGSVLGRTIYVDRITYTGHGTTEGLFEVDFVRDREMNEPRRRDVSISGRNGFKEVTADLLREVHVKFDNDQVRRYALSYQEGAFFKTLLTKIEEFDSADSLFTSHELEYYDDVRNGGTYQPFNPQANWNPGSDNIEKNFITSISGFKGEATALSGNESEGYDVGFGVQIGLCDGKPWCKSLTVGGKFSYGENNSDGRLLMVDINGDALPDKVMLGGNGFSYRENLSGPDGVPNFGPVRPISGINSFYKEKSRTSSKGFELHGGCGAFTAFVGVSRSKTTSTTSIFFSDVNGDQLIDISVNGQVFFNRLDVNGNPQYIPSSAGTPSPIFSGDPIAQNIFTIDSLQREEDIDNFPLHDVVRMWEAPYSGTIDISASVRLIEDTSPARASAPADGVRLVIQHAGTELWRTIVAENDYSVQIPTGTTGINVQQGDRIYFRVQSVENGEYDQVEWNPEIAYTSTPAVTRDANDKDIYAFVASDDYLLSQGQSAGAPIDGRVRLTGSFTKPITSDSVRLLVLEEFNNTILFDQTYSWDTQVNFSYDTIFDVTQGMNFIFQVIANTNVDWTAVTFDNHYRYIASYDPNVASVIAQNGDTLIQYYPSPSYSIFAEPFTATNTWKAPADGVLKVAPILSFANAPSGEVTFTVKQKNKLIGKKFLTVTNGVIVGDSLLTVPVSDQEEYYIEYHSPTLELEENFLGSEIDLKFCITDTLDLLSYGVTQSWTAPIEGDLYISPQISFYGAPSGGIRRLVNINGNISTDTVAVLLGNADADTLVVPIGNQQTANFNYPGGLGISNAQVNTLGAEFLFIHRDTIGGAFHPLVIDPLFGAFYRQWGQFGYNGNRARENMPIDESKLELDSAAYNSASITLTDTTAAALDSAFQAQGGFDPSTSIFIPMFPNMKDGYWQGYDNLHYVAPTVMSSSRLGMDDLSQSSPLPDSAISIGNGYGAGAYAIRKVTKSRSTSFSAGGGAYAVSGSYGQTDSESKVIADFLDMNGDRHPDIVTSSVIQYTNPYGGLSSQTLAHGNGANHRSDADSKGVTLGGAYVTPEHQSGTANQDKGAKTHTGLKGSIGLNGNFGESEDETGVTYQDVNGDGLPDRLYQSGGEVRVALNLGYKFAPQERWDTGIIGEGESESFGAGLGINIGNMSIGAGIGLSRSENESEATLQDVNGDGLTDRILDTGSGMVAYLNTGNGFAPAIPWSGAPNISESFSVGENLNFTFTFGFCFPIIPIKITFTPYGAVSKGMSSNQQQISDVDGDGYPDYLTSSKDDNLQVKTSTIGRTNMLKAVNRPMGASFALDYKRVGNTYEMPNSVWTLSEVDVYDGFAGDGADHIKTAFKYEDGYYDRHEREFYGFEKVRVRTLDTEDNDALYTETTMEYENSNYYEKGLVVNETMADAGGAKYIEKRFTYQPQDVQNGGSLPSAALQSTTLSIFPSLRQTQSLFYEGQPTAGKSTRMIYGYDRFGNTTQYTDFGDFSADDDLFAEITYHNYPGPYLVGIPQSIQVYGNSSIFRKREAAIDSITGNLTQIRQYLQNGDAAEYNMTYDVYGNMSSIARPENANGQSFTLDYQYDPDINTYVTQVDDSYGYTSTATYDYRYGATLLRTDLNGHTIENVLDDVGRISTVTGPFEAGTGQFTLRFEYHPDATVPWALTEHYDPTDSLNTIQTGTFMDGLGRVVQVKKDIALYQGDGVADLEAMQVSGQTIYDAFGRTIKNYYPVTEPLGTIGVYNPTFDTEAPTTNEYDVLNRVVLTTLPDNAQTAMAYGFGPDRNNVQQFSTLVTDANGIQTEQFNDVRERLTAMKNITSFGDVWTSFAYNAINEKVSSTNDLGHSTTFDYDWFGRTVERIHPDQGRTSYEYDLASNLSRLQTANLAGNGQFIEYTYDFERLKNVTYPEYPDNNVEYFYGPAGAPHNRVGRIVVQQDASGAQEFFYGPLGEVVKNIRTVVVPLHGDHTYVTEWTYDTWNRVLEMVYPDEEVLTYTYNQGGLLRTMYGEKAGNTYNYVDQLGYDKFEDRVFLAYGNGTKTEYEYEPDRRRLQHMVAKTALGREMMDNVYTYDLTRNILNVTNSAPVPSNNLMGGPSSSNYNYDDLYRLVQADGNHQGSSHTHRYNLGMTYNTVGGITEKDRTHERKANNNNNWVAQGHTSYNLQYDYDPVTQPHAPIHIGDRTFSYDRNGNQTGWDHDINGTRRNIVWDEENRMRLLYDNGTLHHYVYDADDIRVLKGQGSGQLVSQNGGNQNGSVGIGNYTIYVNPYTVARSGGYTKHFFIESQRIVSKLGDTHDLGVNLSFRAGEDSVDYGALLGGSQTALAQNLGNMGMGNVNVTAITNPNGNGNAYGYGGNNGNGNGNGGGSGGGGGNNGNGNGGNGGNGNGNGGGNGSSNPGEFLQFFFHPDHLGSSSYITDALGEAYQHLEYFPFGETFVEEHSNTWRTPYLFNGKELDDETALYYYGARYYDPMTSVWISVDPLADKYAGWSGYNYTLGNPVVLIDPNGEEPQIPYDPDALFESPDLAAIDFAKNYNGISIVIDREFGASIYPVKKSQKVLYKYSKPNIGIDPCCVEPSSAPDGIERIGYTHTHGSGNGYDNFSDQDIKLAKREGILGYVSVPKGLLLKYDEKNQAAETRNSDFPDDVMVEMISDQIKSDPINYDRANLLQPDKLDKSWEFSPPNPDE